MLESCPKKSMVLATVGLGLLTIVVLILESHFASESLSPSSPSHKNKEYPTENNSTCWQHQDYEVITECHPCTDFEIKSKSIGVCIHTHFKEILKCQNGEIVTRSCDRVAHLEAVAYWKFIAWSFVIGVVSGGLVMLRMRNLNRKAMRRVRNQLANGIS